MVGEPREGSWPAISLREVVAFGVYLVVLSLADSEDLSATAAQAPLVARTAVRLTDALLTALKDTSPGESA